MKRLLWLKDGQTELDMKESHFDKTREENERYIKRKGLRRSKNRVS